MHFSTGEELLALCAEHNKHISEITMIAESDSFDCTMEEIKIKMKNCFEVMKKAVEKSITEDLTSMGGLIGGEAKKLTFLRNQNKNVCGTPSQCLDAASTVLKNIMGLVCDPIAGLVEAPCQKRNAIGAANALVSAEIALAGIPSIIPFDESVAAMYKVGKTLPFELRETALGGSAATPTGCSLCKKIFH